MPRERHHNIQSVQRAAAILKAFGYGSPQLGVSEVGRKLKLHKSTASRLLATLESEGLVERVPQSDKYRLGYEFVRLAGQVTHFSDVRAIAKPLLAELAEATRETINLAVLDGEEVVNIEQVSSPHIVGIANWVGRRTPLHCVANGKALLAFLPRAQVEHILSSPLSRFTKHTITSKAALRAELARIRERGYATAMSEIEEGLHAVAAPIFDARGEVVASVSISGPSYRVTPERMEQLSKQMVRTAEKITARLSPLVGVSFA
jgi:DNA-binding IclR family transcriptional regulator